MRTTNVRTGWCDATSGFFSNSPGMTLDSVIVTALSPCHPEPTGEKRHDTHLKKAKRSGAGKSKAEADKRMWRGGVG